MIIHICYPCCHVKKCKRMLFKSIDSVAQHNKKNELVFSFLNSSYDDDKMEFEDEDFDRIRKILHNRGVKHDISVFDVSDLMYCFEGCRPLGGQWNAYKRFFINKIYHEYMPGVERVLYLDEDTLCTGSLEKLYTVDMKGRPFWGLINTGTLVSKTPHLETRLSNNKNYINDGLLLIDVRYNIYPKLNKCIKSAEEWHIFGYQYLHDQTIINMFYPAVSEYTKPGNDIKYDRLKVYGHLTRDFYKRYNIIHYWGHKQPGTNYYNYIGNGKENEIDTQIYELIYGKNYNKQTYGKKIQK